MAFARHEIGFLDARETNLTRIEKRGGKLILFAVWSDPVVPAAETVSYYDAVTKTMGGSTHTNTFARMFLAYGMTHCGGGPGPNKFDALAARSLGGQRHRARKSARLARSQRQSRSHQHPLPLSPDRSPQRLRQYR